MAVCLVAGTMSGAVRAVILQHFARGGRLPPGKDPDFGDISLKESNQDKAGKIVGLFVGVALLGFIGIGSGKEAEAASLRNSLRFFLLLTVIHLLGNVQAVRQLDIEVPEQVPSAKQGPSGGLREMFLPRGYPSTVVDSYARFRISSLCGVLVGYPKQIVTSMLFWGNVFGVGNKGSSPVTAVLTDIFMTTVDCVVGLLAGLPIMARLFNYSEKRWFLISGTLQRLAEFIQLAAILTPGVYFYVLIVMARSLQAFAATAGSRINGSIAPALMKKECAERREIELIHVNVAGGNQDKVVSLPSGLLSILFLYYMVFSGWQPSLRSQIIMYCFLQVISFCSLFGCFQNLPPLPGQGSDLTSPLLREGLYWEEQNDLDSEVANAFSGPASLKPVLVRSSSRN